MTARTSAAAGPTDRILVIERVFDAPPELVFKAWTEREAIMRWMAPTGFTIPSCDGDLRPGGAWRMSMRTPDGAELRLEGVYREIVPPRRLVFTHVWLDGDGRPGHETLVTVTFADRGGKTALTFQQAVFESQAERDAHRGGWTECFDRLGAYLDHPAASE
ncbi:MAG: SRPBCC family protein [Gemmatimonadales bacterium]